MKRLQMDRVSRERKQDMSNLIRCWKSSGLTLSVLEESLRTLAKEERPKADQVRLRSCGTEATLFVTFARGRAVGRSRASVTRDDAEFLMGVIAELKKEVPGLNDSPEDAKALLDGAASVLFNGGATEDVPARLQEPLRKALFRLDPATSQEKLF